MSLQTSKEEIAPVFVDGQAGLSRKGSGDASSRRRRDLRATPEFSRLRHEVWSLLRDEFRQAEILERHRASRPGAAA